MIVCFDIGGTAIKGALATSPEDIRPFPRQPTPIHDFDAFVATLASVIAEAEAIAGERAACIAISIAGVIDPDTANAVVANIPCIHGRPLQADLEAALGLPVIVANDADCFVLAEAGDMDEAVKLGLQVLGHDGVLLLSPGAPSFPRYRDYIDRGRHFAKAAGFDPDLINTIPGLGVA